MNRRVGLSIIGAASIAGLFVSLPLDARQVDVSALDRIRDEGLNRSQVMDIVSYLTDVYGPRLTGSPNIKAAGDWAVDTMKAWGLTDVALEPWENRRGFDRGWSNDKFYLAAVVPQAFPIAGTPTAWTPGTNGLVRGEVICVIGTTEAELAQFRGTLKGKFVITAPAPAVQAFFDQPLAIRQTTEQLDRLGAARPGGAGGGARGGPPPTAGAPPAAAPTTSPTAPQLAGCLRDGPRRGPARRSWRWPRRRPGRLQSQQLLPRRRRDRHLLHRCDRSRRLHDRRQPRRRSGHDAPGRHDCRRALRSHRPDDRQGDPGDPRDGRQEHLLSRSADVQCRG